MVDQIIAKFPDQSKNHLKPLCGLPVSPYFSALKIRWLKQNVPAVKKAMRDKRCKVGTMDTWIIWNLTGGKENGLYITDVTNASRTMLMNIETLAWDPTLCRYFDIPMKLLPEIRSSSEVYGRITVGPLEGIPISGILGNQQAALVGQNCLKKGQAKNTYRSGCFLLLNTGTTRVYSSHGLVTTVAYKMGPNSPAVYALEGSVAVAGAAIKWLRDNLKLIKNVSESEDLAQSVFSTGDVYFVPAFNGLYAPYWRKDARGIICGLTAFTTKQHIIRASLEAVCFQTRDILEAMNKDCGFPLTKLHTDGKMSTNNLLMQLQADLCGIPVFRSKMPDITTLGAAVAAGQAEGIEVWDLEGEEVETVPSDTFLPTTTPEERDARYKKWKMAVQRSLGWAAVKMSDQMTDERYRILASIPASWFIMSSFILLRLSYYFENR
uniref:glycerol kinase n=2 Tax=Fopius arisanus TaxID=64838 RepID=A0A0C9RC94_9HYME